MLWTYDRPPTAGRCWDAPQSFLSRKSGALPASKLHADPQAPADLRAAAQARAVAVLGAGTVPDPARIRPALTPAARDLFDAAMAILEAEPPTGTGPAASPLLARVAADLGRRAASRRAEAERQPPTVHPADVDRLHIDAVRLDWEGAATARARPPLPPSPGAPTADAPRPETRRAASAEVAEAAAPGTSHS